MAAASAGAGEDRGAGSAVQHEAAHGVGAAPGCWCEKTASVEGVFHRGDRGGRLDVAEDAQEGAAVIERSTKGRTRNVARRDRSCAELDHDPGRAVEANSRECDRLLRGGRTGRRDIELRRDLGVAELLPDAELARDCLDPLGELLHIERDVGRVGRGRVGQLVDGGRWHRSSYFTLPIASSRAGPARMKTGSPALTGL